MKKNVYRLELSRTRYNYIDTKLKFQRKARNKFIH